VVRTVQYLLARSGRNYARLVVPRHLRPFLNNKTELRTPLGGDYREALKTLHAAVANLQFKIREAEIRAADTGIAPKSETRFRTRQKPASLSAEASQRTVERHGAVAETNVVDWAAAAAAAANGPRANPIRQNATWAEF
jgi:hypothetical protein